MVFLQFPVAAIWKCDFFSLCLWTECMRIKKNTRSMEKCPMVSSSIGGVNYLFGEPCPLVHPPTPTWQYMTREWTNRKSHSCLISSSGRLKAKQILYGLYDCGLHVLFHPLKAVTQWPNLDLESSKEADLPLQASWCRSSLASTICQRRLPLSAKIIEIRAARQQLE